MTDAQHSDPQIDQHNADRPKPPAIQRPPVPRTRRTRSLMFATLIVAAGLTGAAVTKASSNPFIFASGWHASGMHRFGGGPMGRMDPAMIEDRADRMVRHLAIELDANVDQQERLRGIMRSLVKDVVPMREKTAEARRQARDLLTQTTIDRAAMEKLRAEQIALADSVSRRIVQALGDASDILSPEQRRKLNDRFPPFGESGFGPGGRRG
jgi:periplasmic protein CpxP/Spy